MSTDNLLWVDKHRPSTFGDLSYNETLTDHLRSLSTPDLPHLLLYGPSGAGKRTRIHCILRKIFGAAVEKKRVQHRVFKVGDTSKQIEVTTVASTHHIEVNPSESGHNDRLVVMELIKDVAASAPLDGVKRGVKIVVLHEVDRMSRLAQQALRRTMEKFSRTCRIIMVAESVSRVIEPLRSRCLGVRVPLPTEDDVKSILQSIAVKEGVTLPAQLAETFTKTSSRNLRRAILQFEATRVSVGALDLPPDAPVMKGDWEYAVADIAVMLTRIQAATQLVSVRKRLQELLAHAVPPDVILRRLTEEILRIADDEICPEICRVAAKFDRNLSKGTKPIFHLEAFGARFMQIYSEFLRRQVEMMD